MSEELGEPCPRHPDQETSDQCGHCDAPICRDCIKAFGYYCSADCLQAERQAVSAAEKEAIEARRSGLSQSMAVAKRVVAVVVALAVLIAVYPIWKYFLDPAGKVAWQWEHQADLPTMHLLGAIDDHVYAVVGQEFIVFDAGNGDVLSSKTSPDLAEVEFKWAAIEQIGDAFYVAGSQALSRVAADGSVTYSKALEGSFGAPQLDAEGRRGYYVIRVLIDREKWTYKSELVCFDLATGKDVWTREMQSTVNLTAVQPMGDTIIGMFTKRVSAEVTATILCAMGAADGQRRWQSVLPVRPTYGPVVEGRQILLRLGDALVALSPEGQQNWSLALPADGEFGIETKADMFFLQAGGQTVCYDIETGEKRWQGKFEFEGAENVIVAGKRLFIHGYMEEKVEDPGVQAPSSLDRIDEIGGLGELEGLVNTERPDTRTIPVMLCLDRGDGDVRWFRRFAVGDFFGNEDRLVLLQDTQQTSRMQQMKGGKGETAIQQYDLGDGDNLYARRSDLGVAEPVMVGKRLVGLAYERREETGLVNMGFSMGGSTEEAKPLKGLGLVAFRLK